MAWTKSRNGLRYASDTTAMKWILLSELLPQRSLTGRPPKWHLRTIMDAILHILATGLPMACFAERLSNVHDGSALPLRLARPKPTPSAGITDSQKDEVRFCSTI
jgi:hypothetical protein